MRSGILTVSLVLILAFAFTTVDAATECKTKWKTLSTGSVEMTTSFCNVAVGETVKIEITNTQGVSYTIRATDPVSIRKVTPPKGGNNADISVVGQGSDYVMVKLDGTTGNPKTVHLSVFLNTGEKVGVNLKMPR